MDNPELDPDQVLKLSAQINFLILGLLKVIKKCNDIQGFTLNESTVIFLEKFSQAQKKYQQTADSPTVKLAKALLILYKTFRQDSISAEFFSSRSRKNSIESSTHLNQNLTHNPPKHV